ncbi:extracellular substrate binding-like orphan protein GrrP [Gloeobacter morelensis]|uniref:Extracellular substrate binding-like orphan protein GrrP n=1 Tax=Gloeobacter morelensis MG652769 TaxID=2781736 RepID=A0ABY3PMD8_9CYAN|nr:extracellular substrate binding-like orphan protein GrrP [Gloeobacter morelensis]UFP94749.1 extracellular substrate binding-like orphan protein GrrP [Gloeobacter morelensis MG652769]
MLQKLSVAITAGALLAASALPGSAETVLEKVARTGILSAGLQMDLVPYAYLDDKDNLVGHSVDLIAALRGTLSQYLKRDIVLDFEEVKSADRIPKVVGREVDIVCDSVFYTWERDRFVDYSLTYAITGIRLLVKKDSALGTPQSLSGKRIVAGANSPAEQTIRAVQPQVVPVAFATIPEAYRALVEGKVDAVAGDSIALAGFRATLPKPDDFKIVPQEAYSRYGVACITPEDNSKFLDLVNYTIVSGMQGYIDGDPAAAEKVDRWFGPDGLVKTDPKVIRDFYQQVIDMREQVQLAK